MAEQFDWHEGRKKGVGHDFLEEMRLLFQQIQEKPEQNPQVHKKVRRALVRKFPFKVFYLFASKKVEVIGVVQARGEQYL